MVLLKYKESKTYLYETLEPQWFDHYFDWKKDGRKVSIRLDFYIIRKKS